MAAQKKMMFVFAHPDDESNGAGGMAAKYAAEGVEISLITATRGERGWFGAEEDNPGLDALGQIREQELFCAAEKLGIKEVHFLDYIDGDLDQADPAEAVAKITAHIRRFQPQIIVTFAPDGGYGHPDHIAICQFTQAAILNAVDPTYETDNGAAPHRVSKLYYMVFPYDKFEAYRVAFGDIVMLIDGEERRPVSWENWAITTLLDTSAYADQVWEAIRCHHSQLQLYDTFNSLPKSHHTAIFGTQELYRAMSLVNGGRKRETDVFDGID